MKEQKGITLIALIITIIVMLILVGVSVSVALNTGLFTSAGGAAKNTQIAADAETALSNGTIKIEGLEGEISIDNYVASLKGEDGTGDLAIGDEVTLSNGETFYVIGFLDGNTKVKLLAKNNINTTTLLQDASAGNVAFSSTNYWSTIEGITYPYDLNDTPTSADTDAIALARIYGENLGGEGRLMTYEEAQELDTETYSDILYGTNGKSSCEYLNFWCGTASGDENAYACRGSGKFCISFHMNSEMIRCSPGCGNLNV